MHDRNENNLNIDDHVFASFNHVEMQPSKQVN